MVALKFKTSMKCNGCVATATPFLAKIGVEDWEIDLQNKTITVKSENIDPGTIIQALEEAGFTAERIFV